MQRDLTDRLSYCFRQFDPPRFAGVSLEPWEAESRVAVMEKLFENLFFILVSYEVFLAAHFLECDAEVW